MYIDAVLLGIVLLCLIMGIKKGFIFEFFSLFGIMISVMLSKRFVTNTYDLINRSKEENNFKFILAYVLTFLAIYIVLYIILSITKKFFEKIMLGWVDKIGGGLVGLLKGVAISFIAVMVLVGVSYFSKDIEEYLKDSYSGKIAVKVSPAVIKLFPEKIVSKFKTYKKEANIDEILKDVLNNELGNKNTGNKKDNKNKKEDKMDFGKMGEDLNKLIEKEMGDKNLEDILKELKKGE